MNIIYDIIEKNKANMINLQKGLSKIPALSPENGGDGEQKKVQFLKSWIENLGISVEEIQIPDSRVSCGYRPSLIATIKGKNPEKNFWIMTHTDVVPPGDPGLWIRDPYEVTERDGMLFGRGVEDNQQSLVASLYGAAAFVEGGITPEYTVKLLFVADEETGSEYGISALLGQYDLFKADDLILVPDGGNMDGSMIEVAEKNILWLKFHTTGVQCHASMPGLGKNAFLGASAMVVELQQLHNIFDQKNELFNPPVSTFSPTKKQANVPNINTIPGDDVFFLDCRILPETDVDDVLRTINKLKKKVEVNYEVTINVETVIRETSPATPENTPLVEKLKNAIKEIYDVDAKPMGIGGGTVAAQLRKMGYPTIVWSKILDTAHMPNEHSLITNMIGDAKVMARIMGG